MAEEDTDLIAYKDISELKKEFEGIRGKKDVPLRELYDAVQKLSQTISDMLDVFSAAAEQMKLEEKEYQSEAKRHDIIISKLDKIIDQNKTIAEGMVAIVDMVKEKLFEHAKEELFDVKEKKEPMFSPKPEPSLFAQPMQPEWQPKPEPFAQTPPMPKSQPQPIWAAFQSPMPPPTSLTPPMPPLDFGMPPMEPTPSPDLDFSEEPFSLEEEQPKKKGLFGMFKK